LSQRNKTVSSYFLIDCDRRLHFEYESPLQRLDGCHSIKPKHAQRYLAEFQYKYNHCYDLGSMIERLLFVSLKTVPMPKWMLRLD